MKPLNLNKTETQESKRVKLSTFSEKLAFNFSYISKDKKYSFDSCNKIDKASLMKQILFMSNMTKVELLSLPKDSGLEKIPEKACNCTIKNDFKNSGRYYACAEDFWVARFNGKKSRVLGMMNDNIFYVLFIDLHLNAYDHG